MERELHVVFCSAFVASLWCFWMILCNIHVFLFVQRRQWSLRPPLRVSSSRWRILRRRRDSRGPSNSSRGYIPESITLMFSWLAVTNGKLIIYLSFSHVIWLKLRIWTRSAYMMFGLVNCRRVLIFPKGNNVDHLSLYLDVADSAMLPYGWSRYAQFSLSVVNQIHSKFNMRKGIVFAELVADWWWISIKDCVLLCALWYIVGIYSFYIIFGFECCCQLVYILSFPYIRHLLLHVIDPLHSLVRNFDHFTLLIQCAYGAFCSLISFYLFVANIWKIIYWNDIAHCFYSVVEA